MELRCVHKNLKNKVTVTEYPDNYFLKGAVGIKEITSTKNLHNKQARTKQILLNGVRIEFLNDTFREDRIYEVRSNFPYLQMQFVLKGSIIYTPRNALNVRYAIYESGHALCYFPELDGQLVYLAGEDIFSIQIEISMAWLKNAFNGDLSPLGEFSKKMKHRSPAMLGTKSFPITLQIREILLAIYHCNFTPYLKKIFIEGKLLELLSLQVKQMVEKNDKLSKPALKKDDIERVHYIKEILTASIHNPHSINDLANIACMNRTKLQSVFKNLFGNTIYGFLAEERMKKAYELLLSPDYVKIAEIARQVGYKNPNHFSTAFKTRFGFSPKSIQNQD